jgi:signal transduction histidine kinase
VTASTDPSARVQVFARGADFALVGRLLAEQRDPILSRWLDAASAQPFHQTHQEGAVADDIPRLFDALVALLQQRSASQETSRALAPLGDSAVSAAAQAHARTRSDQGLASQDIVIEFRLLRQEIGRAVKLYLPDTAPASDIAGAELIVHDALDGAIFLAISAITQRETEREALDAARVTLKAEHERFVAALAHDVNNPLARIKGTVQLLQRRIARGAVVLPEVVGALDIVSGTVSELAERMTQLVEGMRHREGASRRLERGPVDLAVLTRRVASLHQAGTDQHQLEVNAPASIVGTWDESQLTRVLDNLLRNALKYSPAGGTIVISVRGGSRRGVRHALLSVADQGIGIPAGELLSVFEPFRRGSNVVRSIPGSGIGLFAVRQIVEQHGGTVSAQSREGRGSTFTVRLPLAPAGPDL